MITAKQEKMDHPFVEVELQLQNPRADGVFVLSIEPESPPAKAGLRQGDIIVKIGGVPLADLGLFFKEMQPKRKEDNVRQLEVTRRDHTVISVEIPASIKGLDVCWVKKGQSAWSAKLDYQGEPDFSWITDKTEKCLRNSFGEELAGFEWMRLTRRGELIDVDIWFCLGGGSSKDDLWDYYTRCQSTHRLDKYLSVINTTYTEGKPGGDISMRHAELGKDGIWRGYSRTPDGAEHQVQYPSATESFMTGYGTTLLPLTMPFKPGDSLTFFGGADGEGQSSGRARIECLGKRQVKVLGKDTDTWAFAWRHYGERKAEDDETFYLSPDRKIVRVDWGPGYGGCRAELVPKEDMMYGIPDHVRKVMEPIVHAP